MADDLKEQLDWIARLVAFDTTSRNSNLDLIADVEGYLSDLGIKSHRVYNDEGDKANLYCTVGPMMEGGVVLSGHTDVVPVDGQRWDTDPWTVVEKDSRLYGRGTADMKSFSAIGLSLVPDMLAANLKRPIHFALSYDEEVGLMGAPDMIKEMTDVLPAPGAVIVGEPTDMKVVDGHKGMAIFRTEVIGHEAHSSQPHRGVSANMTAVRLIGKLMEMMETRKQAAKPDCPFDPPYTTITVGLIKGGTAVNILARECSFQWDVRTLPPETTAEVRDEFLAFAAEVEAEIQDIAPDCRILTMQESDGPAFMPVADNPAAELAHLLTGSNSRLAVSYGTEAGQFQEAGHATVICGPGSINQAHQPNEYITLDQVAEGTGFIRKLIRHLAEGQ